jgi:hypothetical protein
MQTLKGNENMAKLWREYTLRERIEVLLATLVNEESEAHPWGKHFWLTSSRPEALTRALENLKKVPQFELENMNAEDSKDGGFAFQGGKIDALIHSLCKL